MKHAATSLADIARLAKPVPMLRDLAGREPVASGKGGANPLASSQAARQPRFLYLSG